MLRINFRRCMGTLRALQRCYSTARPSPHHDPSKIRNMALVAHIDSGKTTLTESILLRSGYLSSPGTVDTGSTTTDFLPAERERGITIQSASIPVQWKEWSFNLIDTPGHADFGMEVESASRVVDGAIVLIDSVEGVEAQTKGVWKQLDRYNVPTRILFLNKLDRTGASFHSSVLSILQHRLHPRPVCLTLPVASFNPLNYSTAEPGIEGIVDLVKWEIWKWNTDGTSERQPLPRTESELSMFPILPENHPLKSHLISARMSFLEALSLYSDELLEILLDGSGTSSYLAVTEDLIIPALKASTSRKELLPIVCGSAMRHIGTDIALDYAGLLLAGPSDVFPTDKNGPLQLLAWKVSWDKRRGWMTFVRVYSGTLTTQSQLVNTSRNERERVSKLMLLYANQPEEVDSLEAGAVGVILGLKHTRTGDTLVSSTSSSPHPSKAKKVDHHSEDDLAILRNITPPPPVMSASIIPETLSDLQPVQDAITALARTDPSVRFESLEGQLLLHGLGALHLEIVEGRLRDEWGVKFETGSRRVGYRETLDAPLTFVPSEWKTDIRGKTVSVTLDFEVRPLNDNEVGDPAWDGNLVVDENNRPLDSPDKHFDTQSPWGNIAQGIANTLSSSPHTSLPLSGVYVQIRSFQKPPEAHASILAGAISSLLRQALRAGSMGSLMEPFVQLQVEVGDEHLGKVVKDITEHGGEVLNLGTNSYSSASDEDVLPYSQDGVYLPPEWMSPSAATRAGDSSALSMRRNISALAPLSQMLDYNNRLRALSGGHGTFDMVNAGFRVVTQERRHEILKELGRA